ncbi:hypothetical protein HKX48_008478 [Thoreauomyces humboldtii]|nr:hypothetical protein HKX48_008478 [Thoreauomyces humboldtii]
MLFNIAAVALLAAVSTMVEAVPINATSALVPGKYFDHVMTVFFENTDYSDVIADSYFGSLTTNHNGKLLTNYNAIAHPSQPNYIAMLTGGKDALLDTNVNVNKKNLVDLLESKSVSWKSYQENYPSNCATGDSKDGLYRRKHNPFISMNDVRTSSARCAKIVDATELQKDIKAGTVPQYTFYTPNMDHDGHDTDLKTASAWARSFFEPLLNDKGFMANTLIVITWDESESYFGRNQVAAFALGPVVDASGGKEDGAAYSHYSLLRTIEDNWSLGSLNRGDAQAAPFAGLVAKA